MASSTNTKRTVLRRAVILVPLTLLAAAFALSPFSVQGFGPHGLILSTHTARAATCSGGADGATSGGCNNTDPGTTGCGTNATTPISANTYDQTGSLIGQVEMRWSSACGTNWTRGHQYIGCGIGNCIVAWEAAVAWHSPSSGVCLKWTIGGSSNSGSYYTNQERAASIPVESYNYVEYNSYGDEYWGHSSVTNPGFGNLCI